MIWSRIAGKILLLAEIEGKNFVGGNKFRKLNAEKF
jgi:hypothetical protein